MTEQEGAAWRAGRTKINDGFRLTTWPRFKALMARLGVTVPLVGGTEERVRITFPYGPRNATVTVNGVETDTGIDGFEAFRLPEARAYFELLGIPTYQFVVDLAIDLAVGEFPTWTMRAALAVPADLDPEKD